MKTQTHQTSKKLRALNEKANALRNKQVEEGRKKAHELLTQMVERDIPAIIENYTQHLLDANVTEGVLEGFTAHLATATIRGSYFR